MDRKTITPYEIFDLLEGTWQGEGHGEYPTIDSFTYREKMTCTRKDISTLAYEQRTEKRVEGSEEYTPSHWENGFITILDNHELELVNAQSGGRGEALTGQIQVIGAIIRLNFTSQALMNDARMVSTRRRFDLEADHLRYEMEMRTTEVEQLARHLAITLERVRSQRKMSPG